jgi:hypothetical protein
MLGNGWWSCELHKAGGTGYGAITQPQNAQDYYKGMYQNQQQPLQHQQQLPQHYVIPNMQLGWMCPQCKACFSPSTAACSNCKGDK